MAGNTSPHIAILDAHDPFVDVSCRAYPSARNSKSLLSFYHTVKTQIEERCAGTLELPLLVRRPVYSFCFVSTGG